MKKNLMRMAALLAVLCLMSGCSLLEDVMGEVKPLAMGTMTDDLYTNDLLGVAFEMGDQWTCASEDELLIVNDSDAAAWNAEAAQAVADENGFFYDAAFAAADNQRFIDVTVDDLKAYDDLGASENDYAVDYNRYLPAELKDGGCTDVTGEMKKVELGGVSHSAFKAVYTNADGETWYDLYVFVSGGARYMGVINVYACYEDTTEAALSYFVPYEAPAAE